MMNTMNANAVNGKSVSAMTDAELDLYVSQKKEAIRRRNVKQETEVQTKESENEMNQKNQKHNVEYAIRTLHGRVLKIESLHEYSPKTPCEVSMESVEGSKVFTLPKEAWRTNLPHVAELALAFVEKRKIRGCVIVEIPQSGICKNRWVRDSKARAEKFCAKNCFIPNPWNEKKLEEQRQARVMAARRKRFFGVVIPLDGALSA